MNRAYLCAIIALIIPHLPLGGATLADGGPLAYVINWSGTSGTPSKSSLWSVSLRDGTTTLIGDTGLVYLNSLSISSDGRLFTAGGYNGNIIAEINPLTGRGRWISTVPTGDIRSLAISPEGDLYAYAEAGVLGGPQVGALHLIDLDLGTATQIGEEMSGLVQGMTFSPGGDLYGWHLSYPPNAPMALVEIDRESGALRDVSRTDRAERFQSVEFDGLGKLYAASQTSFYTVDPETGASTLVTSGVFSDVRGLAILNVPEPTVGLLGLVGMAMMTRRSRSGSLNHSNR